LPEPLEAPPAPDRGFSLRTLLRHSSVYSLAPILQRAAGLLLIPLYTGVLPEAEWGALSLADVVILLVPQLVGVNLLGGMTRFYFERREPRERAAVVSTTTILLTGAAWLVVGLALPFRQELAALLFENRRASLPGIDFASLLTLALLIVPFSISSRCGVIYLQILKYSGVATSVQTAKTVLELTLKIVMLVGFGWGMYGFLLATLVGEISTTVGLTGWMLWRVRPRIVWRAFTPLLAYSLPMLPVGLFQLGLHQADRFLLNKLDKLDGLESAGIYALGYQVGFLIHTALMTSFMQIWQPLIFGVESEHARRRTMVRVGTYAMVILAAAYVPVILFSRQIVELLAGQPGYLPAYRVAPWITCSYLFYAVYSMSQVSLFVAKRTFPLVWINGLAFALNVALNLALIPRFGFVGAAYATMISFAVLAALGALASRRLSELPFEPLRVLGVLACGLACVALAVTLDERFGGGWGALPVGGTLKVCGGLVVAAILWRGVLDEDGRLGLAGIARDVLERVGRL